MVIVTAPVGEYDKRVVILSKERGRIAAFARGAKKPNNPMAGMLNPCSFGEFCLYEGRTSYTLVSASISNYFEKLREDVEAACYGFYFLDISNYYAKESNDETLLLKLLYQTLQVLTKKKLPNALIRYIFELKTIMLNGEGPEVFRCVSCGCSERPAVFSVKRGGLVCKECNGGVADGMILDTSTLYTLQYISSASVEKLYTFIVSEHVFKELKLVVERYMEVYVDKRFKSLEILNQMTELH